MQNLREYMLSDTLIHGWMHLNRLNHSLLFIIPIGVANRVSINIHNHNQLTLNNFHSEQCTTYTPIRVSPTNFRYYSFYLICFKKSYDYDLDTKFSLQT